MYPLIKNYFYDFQLKRDDIILNKSISAQGKWNSILLCAVWISGFLFPNKYP